MLDMRGLMQFSFRKPVGRKSRTSRDCGFLASAVPRLRRSVRRVLSPLGVEEQRVNVIIDLASPTEQWAGLGDGDQVDTRIAVLTVENATIVLAGALFRRGDSWHVYVVKDGRAELQAIQLLRRSGRLAAVASDLEPGTRVIVYPADNVVEHAKVEVR
jgi:HlyD family secretion protein